jgi:23S rRNA (guanosine2251-2'-O)-methyltransferase
VQETATVARVSAGASAYVPIVVVANVPSALGLLKDRGFWVYGADMQGSPCHGVDLTGKVGLVLGGEGSGMHRLVRERCDALVAIPSAGHVDSFNVSVAAGILLYEVRRQQNAPGVPH